MEKQCAGCKEFKTLDEFYVTKHGKNGRDSRCKKCRLAEKALYDKTHPEIRAKIRKKAWETYGREYQKKWVEANKEKARAYYRKYYHTHKEKMHAYNSEWKAKNPEYDKQWKRARSEKMTDSQRAEVNAARRVQYQKHPGRGAAHTKRAREKFPEKAKARTAVFLAVRAGKVPSAQTLVCVRCGKQAKDYHHHKGYDKEHWLDVVPACRPCHAILERERK